MLGDGASQETGQAGGWNWSCARRVSARTKFLDKWRFGVRAKAPWGKQSEGKAESRKLKAES